jgi:hypothetical protein
MARALGRIVMVPLAFILAGLTSLFVTVSIGQELIVQAMTGRGPEEATFSAALDLLRLSLAFASVQALLPALLLVIIGEVGRIRTAMYYVIGGGVALALVPLLSRLAQPSAVLGLAPAVWQVLATAGFAGGFVYWLLAGRNA